MKMKKNDDMKRFNDFTFKTWLIDGSNIIIGESFSKIMKKESETFEVKDILYGEEHNSWRIVITTEGRILLLKTSKELT
jgi:hypothetical protein